MKRSVKLFAAVLSLVMLLTVLPLNVMAVPAEEENLTTVTVNAVCYNSSRTLIAGTYATKILEGESVTVNSKTFDDYITFNGKPFEFCTVRYNNKDNSSVVLNDGQLHEVTVVYVPHTHYYTPGYNRVRHWDGCLCGKEINSEKHVDPVTDSDGVCTCGYQFSSNANLVTLWLANMVLEPRFTQDNTEYNATIHTYKDVTSTDIRVRTCDLMATVELPTDVSVQDGMNVYQITVTAEDRKTTKTYTVYASRPVTADGMQIGNTRANGEAQTVAAPKAVAKKRIASVALTDAIGQAMADQAKQNESSQVVLQPTFSKWANDTLQITASAAALKAIAESKVDFVIKTWQGDVIIPSSQLDSLSGQGETIVLSIAFKDGPLKCTVTADGNEIDASSITVK